MGSPVPVPAQLHEGDPDAAGTGGSRVGVDQGPQVSATSGQYAEPESSAVNFKSSSIDVGWFFMRV
jgi:hypothetical protein